MNKGREGGLIYTMFCRTWYGSYRRVDLLAEASVKLTAATVPAHYARFARGRSHIVSGGRKLVSLPAFLTPRFSACSMKDWARKPGWEHHMMSPLFVVSRHYRSHLLDNSNRMAAQS